MWQRFVVALAVVVSAAAGLARAQTKYEHLLPAKSQFYMRWDGIATHRAAYEKTAVGQMMKGDTGEFLQALTKYIGDQIQAAAALQGNKELAGALKDEIGGALDVLNQHGLIVGVEVQKVEPFQMETVVIFPGGAGETKSPLSLINTLVKLNPMLQVEMTKMTKQGQRDINHISDNRVHMSWWAEGKDAVVVIGTTDRKELLKRFKKGAPSLATLPAYQDMKEFKEFKTWFRGYLDLPGLGQVASGAHKDIPKIIDALGLNGIKSVTFYSGFDGPAERSVTFLNLNDGPRKGILKLANKQTFTLQDLPPLPPHATSFSASNLDLAALYESGVEVADVIVNIFAPPGALNVKKAIADFEQANNVSAKEILDSLGTLNVQYYDGTEGALGMGQVSLLKVKDAEKLETGLAKVFQALQNQFGGIVSTRISKYHGAKLYTLVVTDPNGKMMQSYSYTIHKDWMALGAGAPALKGLILRMEGSLPAWKADGQMQKALAKFPKDFTGIHVSDPRPSVRLVLSVLPFAMAALNGAMSELNPGQQGQFDLTLLPNPYEATRHLFPNVTITTDEGHRLRSETRASLMFPF